MPDWDKAYGEATEPLFGNQQTDFVRAVASRPDFAARSALCLADGDGRNSRWLALNGLSVTAVDISAVATDLATALDRQAMLDIDRLVADLELWKPAPEERWDAVFVIYLQCESVVRSAAIATACRHLNDGGWLVAEGFARQRSTQAGLGPANPDLLYDIDELHQAASGLKEVEAQINSLHLSDGVRHQGLADVVTFAARK